MEPAEWCELLRRGSIEVLGRMPWSSNATFLVLVEAGGIETKAIYKPERGERPLWDFPEGIFRREVAAYELSLALGLSFVPETVVREEGPYGEGSLQRFIEADYEQHYFTMIEEPDCTDALRAIAAFDVVANNADRKGGHVLRDAEGSIYGIDHGLCFHVEPKLRTVMWDFAGERLAPSVVEFLECLVAEEPTELVGLLEDDEVIAIVERSVELLDDGRYPVPDPRRRTHPWPLV